MAPPQPVEDPLRKYARNLTLAALMDELDPGVGRENELNYLEMILSKRKKSNPILVGPAGVGKSQVVYDLARLISSPNYNGNLKGKEIWEVSTTSLISGCSFVGMAEQRMQALLKAASKPNIILFWDEIHTMVGAGAGNKSNNDLGNIMKPALAGTLLSVIGATTPEEYSIIVQDKALNRRFNRLDIKELEIPEVVEVLKGIKYMYERHHGVMFNEQVCELIPILAKQFQSNSNPDAAIDLLDTTGARKSLQPNRWTEEGMNVSVEDVAAGAAILFNENEEKILHFIETISKK